MLKNILITLINLAQQGLFDKDDDKDKDKDKDDDEKDDDKDKK